MQQICHFTARSGPFRCGKEVPAISRIPEPWHDAAMAFSLDLARDSDNFPKKVLALFDKHFGFRRSIFFPYHHTAFPGGQARRVNTLSNYITYGIRYGPMYDYKDHIFRYSSLPPHLKGKRVIFTEDVMTLEDYERTPYGIHMSAEDLYYQAVLFFFLGDRVIGSMGLFHTKEEGGFREEERGLLEYLAELVEETAQIASFR